MDDHQLWIKWPFKYVNGQQTPESKALEALPPEKPLKGYDAALLETNDEALL
jgi:hypothetical protein